MFIDFNKTADLMTLEEMEQEKIQIQQELIDINYKIEMRQNMGQAATEWLTSVNKVKGLHEVRLEQLNGFICDRRRMLRKREFSRVFIDISREYLPVEVFDRIMLDTCLSFDG